MINCLSLTLWFFIKDSDFTQSYPVTCHCLFLCSGVNFRKELAIHTIKILIVIPFIKLSGLWIRTVFFLPEFSEDTHQSNGLSHHSFPQTVFLTLSAKSVTKFETLYALKNYFTMTSVDSDMILPGRIWDLLLRKYSSSFNLPFEPPNDAINFSIDTLYMFGSCDLKK